MSSDPTGHLTAERLDALAEEGARSGGQGAATPPDEHLAGCTACRERLAAVRRVRRLLGEAPDPPLPPGLPERLAAAVGAAQRERAAEGTDRRAAGSTGSAAPAASAGAAGSAGDVVPLRRRPRVPRWLAAAAGLVVLGGSAVTAAELLGSGGPGAAGESAGAGQAQDAAGGAEAGGGAAGGDVQVTASGTAYTAEALGAQVRTLLADPGGVDPQGLPPAEPSPRPAPREPVPPGSAPQGSAPQESAASEPAPPLGGALTGPEGLQACLDALGVTAGTPVAVDLGTWEGRAAAVVVVEDGGAAAAPEVWVVGPGCGQDGDALLHFQRLGP